MKSSGKKNLTDGAKQRQRWAKKDWQKRHRRIYLNLRLYNTWKQLRYEGPYQSDSEFAAYLISLEMKMRER